MNDRSSRKNLSIVAGVCLAGVFGCPTSMPVPPEEPMPAAPEAPRIPWLAAGTPDITPPQIPWLTDESACPEGWGWTEVAPGLNGCDPYPAGRIEDCGPTGAHFPGETGCRDLDSGDTDWPRDLPATNVLYVREGASGGDGSRALPLASLPEALAMATDGTTIALGPGRYDAGQGAERPDYGTGVFETLSKVQRAGVHLRGTSVALTTVFSERPASPTGPDFAMIQVESNDVEISDLRFESPHPAIDAFGGEVTVRRVVLDGTSGGLSAGSGGSGRFEDVIATRCVTNPVVLAAPTSTVSLQRFVLVDATTQAMVAAGAGSELAADAVAVIRSGGAVAWDGGALRVARLVEIDAIYGVGSAGVGSRLEVTGFFTNRVPDMEPALYTRDGASLSLEDALVRGTPGFRAQVAVLPGSSVTMSRAVFAGVTGMVLEGESLISDTLCHDTSSCVEARNTDDVTLSRVEISGATAYGVVVHLGASATVTDLSVHDLSAPGAVGLYVFEAATLRAERVSLAGAQVGLYAQDASSATLSDVAVRDMRTTNTAVASGGILVNGSAVSVRRGLVEQVEGPAFVGFTAGHSLDLEDVVIREFRGPPGNSRGIGLYREGTPSSLVRVDVGSGRGMGVNVLSDARMEDVSIHDVEQDTDGAYGQGLVIYARPALAPAAHVTGARITVHDVAMWGVGGGAPADGSADRLSVALTDVRIERAGAAAEGGPGVFWEGDADLSLSGFVIDGAASVGIMSRRGATLSLSNGLIASTPTCTSADPPLDLSGVQTRDCGTAPVTWTPPEL